MIYTKPYFYDDFKCKADKCTDTCCAGWEVDIDKESYDRYKNVSGEFGERLKDSVTFSDEIPSFRLCENERCVFLNKNGLCDIYTELGEDYLCEICREHPRFYDCFENVTEMGLGLCCEKVCEMIFSSDKAVTFLSYSDNDDSVDYEYNFYCFFRNKCFEIICDRQKSLKDRIKELIMYGIFVQNEFFNDSCDFEQSNDVKSVFKSVIRLFFKTEPINDEWTEYIKTLKTDIENIISASDDIKTKEYEYEQILTYVLYRHFMKSMDDGNILSVICFSVVNVIFIYLCDCKTFCDSMKFSDADRINNVKLWSKQIEYSDINTQLIMDKSMDVLLKNK
ncbi:MAG: flagellin lysine-N-methylase [Clostridia bacterium]|nr:flagellin lysine-N-methylase [Clostridia bacterium]